MGKDKSAELRERLEKYLVRAEGVFKEAKVAGKTKDSEHVLNIALSYYGDALHYHKKGEYITALAALEYGEGWLDAGRYLKLLK